MIGSRVLGAACAAILISSLGALAGCSSDEKPEGATAATIQAASVSLAAYDANGVRVAEGSGILVSPRVVLTAGHLVAGNAKWVVTASNRKSQAYGVRGLTYDWKDYDSNKSHPRTHDVGVVYLDRPINLSLYPKISGENVDAGSQAMRVRQSSGVFQQMPATLGKYSSFPHAFVTEFSPTEQLDTGGAVVNGNHEIIGVVTGRGLTTGKLYVARVNDLVRWLSPKVACGHKSAKAANEASKGLAVRTYGTPDDDDTSGTAGGNPDGGSGSGTYDTPPSGSNSGNPGSSGTPDDDSNGGSGSPPGSGSGDGIPNSCDDGGGGFNSDGSPNPSTSGGGNPSGGDDSGSSGTNGSSGSNDSSGTSNSGSGTPNSGTDTPNSGSGTPNSGSSDSSSSSSNNNDNPSGGGSDTPSSSSSGNPTNSSSGNNNPYSSGSGDVEACTGTKDNIDLCPPEPTGGGSPDDTIDYGGCLSCGSSTGGTNKVN